MADPQRQAIADAQLDAYVAGHHLKELRKSVGKTQSEVAAASGISETRVSQIENGDLGSMELLIVVSTGGDQDGGVVDAADEPVF
jgi:DNA-binding XRE family transcriptional regulator